MIRVILAVLVAVALLGASLPVLDDVRSTTTVDRLDAGAERLEREAAALAAGSVAIEDPTLAARRGITLSVPTGITAARVDRVAIGDPTRIEGAMNTDPSEPTISGHSTPGPSTSEASNPSESPDVALVYRIEGEQPRVVALSSSTVPTLRVVDGPISLRTEGRSSLELRLIANDGEPTVRISRSG